MVEMEVAENDGMDTGWRDGAFGEDLARIFFNRWHDYVEYVSNRRRYLVQVLYDP